MSASCCEISAAAGASPAADRWPPRGAAPSGPRPLPGPGRRCPDFEANTFAFEGCSCSSSSPYVPSRRKMRDKSWINSRKLKEKVILGLAFEKNWRKIGANVTLQKIIRENRDNFDLIRRNAEGKSLSGGVCVPRGGVRSRPAVAPPPRYCAKQNQPRPSARRGPAGLPALPATMCIRTK